MRRIEELDRFFTLSPDLLSVLDFDGQFLNFNPAWELTFGYTAEELGSSSCVDRVHPDDREQTVESFARLKRDAASITVLNRYACKDGSYKWLRWTCRSDIARQEIYAVARDITPIRRLQDELHEFTTTLEVRVRVREEALRHAWQTLNSILSASPHAIIAVDAMRNVRVWNPAAARIFGWPEEEVLGRKVPFVTDETRESAKRFDERALSGETFENFELRRHNRNGKPIDLLVTAAPTHDADGVINGFLTVATDITERKRLEQQFLRTQRLESLGKLVSGIAHDLNNVLSPIVMGLELFRLKANDPSVLRTLDTLDECAKRGSDLIRQILTFARGVQGERTPVQMRNLLHDIERVLVDTLPKAITVKTDFPRGLWIVAADVTQLHQVIMNLAVNARDAMPDGGCLSIIARNIRIDETCMDMNPHAEAGDYVAVEVRDSGHGIPQELKEKIFEPFFTTKEHGKGTGLGLSTVAAIVKSHGGFVNVYSKVGRGTCFKVYIPALPGQSALFNGPLAQSIPCGNGETILIVDDEAAARDIARLTLEAHGYRVLLAQDGAEGVAQYAKNLGEVHLVLTVMDMPVMNGTAMIRSLERLDPNLRVISVSGLVPAPKHQPANSAFRAALPKPYTAEELLRTVHGVLSSRSS
jgi:PAS domain S-box-containing protein